MGNLLSVSALKTQHTDASTAFLDPKSASGSSSTAAAGASPPPPLYLSDVKAEPAPWSQEGFCMTFQRLFGLLPDSEVRVLSRAARSLTYQHLQTTRGLTAS